MNKQYKRFQDEKSFFCKEYQNVMQNDKDYEQWKAICQKKWEEPPSYNGKSPEEVLFIAFFLAIVLWLFIDMWSVWKD